MRMSEAERRLSRLGRSLGKDIRIHCRPTGKWWVILAVDSMNDGSFGRVLGQDGTLRLAILKAEAEVRRCFAVAAMRSGDVHG